MNASDLLYGAYLIDLFLVALGTILFGFCFEKDVTSKKRKILIFSSILIWLAAGLFTKHFIFYK